jgi:YVTN family beta-propeller protein
VIDTSTNLVTPVSVGHNPTDVAITADGKKAYVTNAGSRSVSVINTATNAVVATVAVGPFPLEVMITPDRLTAYVSDSASASVSVIDTSTHRPGRE